MFDLTTTVLLWFSAIACALMGGVYFAFSTFIMTALGRSGPVAGMTAMNEINTTILGSLFMPLFWGTTLASAALVVIALMTWTQSAAASAVFAGGVIYVIGMFVCTVVRNVPLNNELARSSTNEGAGSAVWQRYLSVWTRWNHVRTIACTLSSILFVYALIKQ